MAPSVETIRAYANNDRIGILTKESHIVWAMSVAFAEGRTDLVQAYSQIRADMRQAYGFAA